MAALGRLAYSYRVLTVASEKGGKKKTWAAVRTHNVPTAAKFKARRTF